MGEAVVTQLGRAQDRFTMRMLLVCGIVVGVALPYWLAPAMALGVTLVLAVADVWQTDQRLRESP